jgi:hypothetical protein
MTAHGASEYEAVLAGIVGLCLCAPVLLSAQGAGAPKSLPRTEKGLELLRVELPDGRNWILGTGGIGRPFMVRLLLTNRGTTTLKIWDPRNSEGSQCPGVILIDTQSQQTVLQPPVVSRSGVPSIWTIEPDQVVMIELDLLRLIGKRSVPPGEYRLQGLYQNALSQSFTTTGVWVGLVASDPVLIQVIAPREGSVGGLTTR